MRENQLRLIFYWLVIVISFLFAVQLLPDFSVLGIHIKKPRLLADIYSDTAKLVAQDTNRSISDTLEKKVAVHRKGKLGIQEFGADNLRYFFESITYSRQRPVRIAFFGDSFIEGDILCGPFRDTLQRIFGGSGVGYVPITSEVTKFRTSIKHDFANWSTFSLVGRRSDYAPLGLPGYCFKPMDGNEVIYKPSKGNFVRAKCFYESDYPVTMSSTLDDSVFFYHEFESSGRLNEYVFPQTNFSSLQVSFPKHDSLRLYGMAFEDTVGVSVDNFGMRSNPGTGLLLVEQDRIKQFGDLRDYKLVLLQFGLNVLSEKDTTGYVWYLHKMTLLINRLKESIPNCGFILISVGDRSSNQQGEFATMRDIFVMRDVQEKIAQRARIAFWDMFEAMGGENSMVRYAESNPPLAAKDYTHLTFRGGRKIAKKLADDLLMEKRKYDAKR